MTFISCLSAEKQGIVSRNLEEVKLLSRVRLFTTSLTVAYQAPPSTEFSRHMYWSGWPFPSPGDFPDPGIEPGSPAWQPDTLLFEPPGKPIWKFGQEVKKETHQVSISIFSCLNILSCCRLLSSHMPQFLRLYLHRATVERVSESTQCWKACLACSKHT